MSRKSKLKKFERTQRFIGSDGREHTVLIYGELEEKNVLSGYAPVKFTRKGRRIVETGDPIIFNNEFRSPLKSFNMGWAICDEREGL